MDGRAPVGCQNRPASIPGLWPVRAVVSVAAMTRWRPRSGSLCGLSVLCLLATSVGCGAAQSEQPGVDAPGGGVVPAKTSVERRVLELLDTLPSGAAQQVEDSTVQATAPYFAASGRRCRQLTITSAGRPPDAPRLACQEGSRWHYVPTVVVGPAN